MGFDEDRFVHKAVELVDCLVYRLDLGRLGYHCMFGVVDDNSVD